VLRRTGIEYSGMCLIGAGAAQISFWLSTALVILIITGRVVTFFNWVIPMWRSAQILNVLAVVLALIGLIGVYKFIRTKPSALDPLSFLFAFLGTLLLLAQRTILLLNMHAPFSLSPQQWTFFTSPFMEAVAAIFVLGYLLIGASVWPFGKLFQVSTVLLVCGAILENVVIDAPQIRLMEAVLSDIRILSLEIMILVLGSILWGIGTLLLGKSLLGSLRD
jgi:hypothetical protein